MATPPTVRCCDKSAAKITDSPAMPASQGARRPNRPPVASEAAPIANRPATPVAAQITVNHAILATLAAASIASTRSGTKIACTPWKLA